MTKRKRHANPPTTIKEGTVKGRLPRGAQYQALKGMGYAPSVRDGHRKARKAVRQSLKRGDW